MTFTDQSHGPLCYCGDECTEDTMQTRRACRIHLEKVARIRARLAKARDDGNLPPRADS